MKTYVEENSQSHKAMDKREIKHAIWVIWLWWLNMNFAMVILACFLYWND